MTDEQTDKRRTHAPAGRGRSGAEATRLAFALVLGALLAVFAVLNTGEVKVDWVLGSAQTPLILVVLICLVFGFAGGYALARKGARARRRKR